MTNLNEYNDVWVFTEIKDHENVNNCALEILGKAREIADQLNQKLVAIVLAYEADKYFSTIKNYGVDKIIFINHIDLKHYHEKIFPELIFNLIKKYQPSIFLFPSTEASSALSARLAYQCQTGLVNNALNLELDKKKNNLLLTDKPAYGGNYSVKIVCPKTRPQMCTITTGTFQKKESKKDNIDLIEEKYNFDKNKLKIKIIGTPTRKDKPSASLSDAKFVIGGGCGIGSKENFEKLYKLADYTDGQVGGTRRPIFNDWMPEHLQIGISGETIKPNLYLAFGISGAIQHVVGITDSETIIAINTDPNASIFRVSDYCVIGDAKEILEGLLKQYENE
ncbi:MAG: electron transfer flavoprotein subunit alpha/FixB family protein [Candidatus Lokiarchaeota archaeon]|nr:electron transfer flavoprotein subunit alpha/FixB family protein [Candidatus Lokiarchaeota archaeon]